MYWTIYIKNRIKELSKEYSADTLVEMFGVSRTHVYRILKGTT